MNYIDNTSWSYLSSRCSIIWWINEDNYTVSSRFTISSGIGFKFRPKPNANANWNSDWRSTSVASSSEDKRKEILKTVLHWFLIKDVYCKKIVHKYCNNSIEIIMSSLLVRALINTSWELPLDSKSLFL